MARARGVSAVSLGTALLLALTATHAVAAPRTERVSTAADGTQGDGASSAAVTTPDGRFVAFRSSATNLVPEGITHPGTYAYVRDLRTGHLTKIEAALSTPRLSADGRWATYIDWGTRKINVFLTDLTTGTRTRVGGDSQDSAASPEISANGRYIAYQWSGHPQFPTRIDLHDRVTGTTETVSEGPADSTRDMANPSLSGDGRLVAYQDDGTGDVWVADRTTKTRTEADDGTPSTVVQLSVNGRVLVMDSADGSYTRDLRTGKVRHFPGAEIRAVSPDGRRLLLQDGQSNLWLLHGGHRVLVGHGSAADGSVSSGGRSVFYSTQDTDVVHGDTNGVYDVFQWRSR
ncbi:protein TolB [Streptomyces sp. NPDC048420]|uniref:protein TolB n=1 Tax=Streptomyces sp. NPDC048420 TaxID=3155755 RepID=UPI00341E1C9A